MNIGFALCGSFCTYQKVFPVLETLAKQHTVTPIFSQAAYTTDRRFGIRRGQTCNAADRFCVNTRRSAVPHNEAD